MGRETQPCENTDRELWREVEGDYYAPSIHVTQAGGIGINVGGTVIVKPLRGWHELARTPSPNPESIRDDVVERACIAFARASLKLDRDVLLFELTDEERRDLIRAALNSTHGIESRD